MTTNKDWIPRLSPQVARYIPSKHLASYPQTMQRLISITNEVYTKKQRSPDLYAETEFLIGDPGHAITWIDTLRPPQKRSVSSLRIFIHAVYSTGTEDNPLPNSSLVHPPESACGPKWSAMFEKLSAEMTGLRELHIYWDAEPTVWHFGGGGDVHTLHAIAQLQGLEKMTIGGYFAKEWPRFLEDKTGLQVWGPQGEEEWYLKSLEEFQSNIRDIYVT